MKTAKTAKTMSSAVRMHAGVPWLFINDRPFLKGIYMCGIERWYDANRRPDWESVKRNHRDQALAGTGMFMFVSNCASDFYERLWGDVWVDEHTFDYSHLDHFMAMFHEIDPSLLVIPKIMMILPRWWEEQHPAEIQQFHDGRTRSCFSSDVAARDQVVSPASELWSADMNMCLERYLDYAESRYGDRIAGYLISGGITHEWGLLGSFDFIDYSAPMRKYWRQWVLREYGGNPPYDIDAIPSCELRLLEEGSFRNPDESRAAMDFQRCLSDVNVERILRFCETVKRKTGGRKAVATYYGYTLTCREGGLDCHKQFLGRYGCGGFQGGHLAMRKLLQSSAVDMVTSPFSYQNRRLGSGDFQPHYAETSLLQHGKVSFLQDDNRSWKSTGMSAIDTGHYAEPENFLRQLRRSFARRLCGDDLVYYADVQGGNYDDPMILAEMRRLQEKFEKYAHLRAAAEAEILIVVDEDSIPWMALSSGVQYQNVYLQSSQWALAGVPYHVMLLSDAAVADLARYKLIFLTNTVCSTPMLDSLVTRARDAGASLLFGPGAGLVGPRGADPELVTALTGMRMELFSQAAVCCRARYEHEGKTEVYGNERPLSHVLTVADPDAEVWSVMDEEDRPALAVKPRVGAKSAKCGFDAYASISPLPWQLLGRLAERAGCHRYGCRGERIWRSPRLLGVHVGDAGSYTLELRSGERIATAALPPRAWEQSGNKVVVDMESGGTAVFAV